MHNLIKHTVGYRPREIQAFEQVGVHRRDGTPPGRPNTETEQRGGNCRQGNGRSIVRATPGEGGGDGGSMGMARARRD